MPETKFENANVGDKVWSVEYGWGEIVETTKHRLRVMFVLARGYRTYDRHGKQMSYLNQSLFWGAINIKPPSKPGTGGK